MSGLEGRLLWRMISSAAVTCLLVASWWNMFWPSSSLVVKRFSPKDLEYLLSSWIMLKSLIWQAENKAEGSKTEFRTEIASFSSKLVRLRST